MQTTNGTSACASCKHQRKKCTEKCILAPFFPVDKTREFQAVHKVFGVSNVTKMLVTLKEEDRRRAVDSLVWEAICRQKEPVMGPYGEYKRIYEELRLYKTQFHQVVPTHEGRIIHKASAAPGLTGWTTNNNKVMSNINIAAAGLINNSNNNKNTNSNNNSLSNIHSNGNSMVGFFPYGYSSHHIQDDGKIMQAERENDSTNIILPQQHLANGFNQPFFFTGQYNQMDSKSMESTLWEAGSSS